MVTTTWKQIEFGWWDERGPSKSCQYPISQAVSDLVSDFSSVFARKRILQQLAIPLFYSVFAAFVSLWVIGNMDSPRLHELA